MMDRRSNKAAKDLIAAIKVVAPQMTQTVTDRAIQAHGGMGASDDAEATYFFRATVFCVWPMGAWSVNTCVNTASP